MKKIILCLALLTLPLASCRKYLEVTPTNVVTLTTYDGIKALMGSYIRSFTTASSNLSGVSIPYRTYQNHLFFAFYGDELNTDYFLNNAYGRNYTAFHRESLNWSNLTFPGTIWSEYFLAIGFLNTVIDALDDVEDGTPEQKDIVRCEAKVLRSWYLFKLQQYFSPYKLDELGIPFNFNSKKIGEYDSGRQTQTTVFNTIIEELTEVLNCTTAPRLTYNIWYDKKIVNAILAQVYNFKRGSGAGVESDSAHAITHAKAAMEGRSIMGIATYEPFKAFTSNTYGIFKDTPQALAVSVTYSTGMYANLEVLASGAGFNPQFARDEVYALYDANDIRKNKFFEMKPNSLLANQLCPAIRKYQGATLSATGEPTSGTRNVLIFNFFPIAELHLIVAESYARQNDLTNAKLWLESFQTERYSGYTFFTGSDVLAEILMERRKEFFLESDYRWCDLIRHNETWKRRVDLADPENKMYTIEKDDFRYCLPIPLTQEMSHNKIEQNPGWSM